MDKLEYKKISFRVNSKTFDDLQKEATKEYLSLSAYIRKLLDKELYSNDIQRTT